MDVAPAKQIRWRSAVVTPRLEDLEQEAWEGFLRTHERLWRALEAGLAQLNVSMAEYSVLALLGVAGSHGMRMSDLAERRLMSSGGFTRLADRLERRGLIERRRSTIDGRSFDAILTTDGRALLRRAWRQHHRDLRALFFNRLDDKSLRCLADVWARLNPSAATDHPLRVTEKQRGAAPLE
ncbi:MAG: MarR family winged helix-turn-helix transcriptional regulator [Acidimicrobiales bacterium]